MKGNISHGIHSRRKEAEIEPHYKFGANMNVSKGSILSVCRGSDENISVQGSSIDLIRAFTLTSYCQRGGTCWVLASCVIFVRCETLCEAPAECGLSSS